MSSNQELSQDILNQLNLRDSREKNHKIDAKYFNAFQQLSQKLNKLSTTTNTLLQGQSHNSETLTSLINSKEIENLKLENTELITNLNNLIINNEKLTQTITAKDQTIKSLTKLNDKLNSKIEALNLEINEKNKTIELINDEVLTNQIQLNVLQSKLESLEK
ncbi:autophagy protein, putative [Candida dubliniensis CD36]|uniref:Autophagy protein, putative n=1 Tax=Candida dubliniensis (strain CD36 / ATCC MYA-646 / CBS 7987 / NCPF 3949 / NRRL Y-17841) TaxID=573826 RepID=B9WI48_CANDC|nr:autophagy protein, putative [Candida dubliniensis CD36]CAX41845.1 autophagy protein, putative [Candida dubliniensis CD36]